MLFCALGEAVHKYLQHMLYEYENIIIKAVRSSAKIKSKEPSKPTEC